jgi:hypothetical protein
VVQRSSVIYASRGSRNSAAIPRLCAIKQQRTWSEGFGGKVVIGVIDVEAVERTVGLTSLLTDANFEYLYVSVWVG